MLGSGIADWYLFFNGAQEDLIPMVLMYVNAAFNAWGLFNTSLTCYEEYMYGLGNPYRNAFGTFVFPIVEAKALTPSGTTATTKVTVTEALTPLSAVSAIFKVNPN